ncbi:hypothetical protein ACFVMC_32995 [Nocardia sp. NPDC127579]|uniref:hypothetical protein n=1 Tax=Nocardia sp. NPDC127579 TaxID=3345402 RepID=UPI00363F3973
MSCKPLITPQDCDPYPSQITPAPEPSKTPGPEPTGFPDTPDATFFGGYTPIPEDLTWAQVGTGLFAIGIGIGVVLVLIGMLMLTATLLAWTPARMRNWTIGALVALPGATALRSWDAQEPYTRFRTGVEMLMSGQRPEGAAAMLVLLIPGAWILATLLYTNRRVQLITHGFQSPAKTERALWLQAQREQRSAARLSRYRLPFSTGGMNPHMLFGRLALEDSAAPPKGMVRLLVARVETRLIVPWINMREHMVTVASSGKGKTTLMLRALLSWHTTAWLRHRQWWRLDRPGRPLSMVIDCNGGPESIKAATRLSRWFRGLGVPASRIGIVTQQQLSGEAAQFAVRLNLWGIEQIGDLRSVLSAMISGGSTPTTDTERYFHNIRETLIHLIVDAPAQVINGVPHGHNPPRDWLEFLSRFDKKKLAILWGASPAVFDEKNPMPWTGVPGVDLELAATLEGKQPVMSSARSEFGNLYRALGDAFDGGKVITDFDVLYIVLEGVKAPDQARAQFAALGCMLEQLADKDHGRESLLAVDEFSAVSDGKTRADAWVMRLRKAKIGTWWFAQHWNGLGYNDEQRQSLVGAGSGGGLHGGQELGGDKLAEAHGTKRRFEQSRKLISGASAGDEGNVQVHDKFLLDPNKMRRMGKGDIVFVSQGRARWGRVSPLDDNTLSSLRPLPRLSAVREAPAPKPRLAPVIDLSKRRHA